jgi:hypothetical protein
MKHWLSLPTSYIEFVLLVIGEILVVSYFFSSDAKYRSKIFWTSAFTALFTVLVIASFMIIFHYEYSVYGYILAYLIFPLITASLSVATYIGLVLVKFVASFFAPIDNLHKNNTFPWQSLLLTLIGTLIAFRLILSQYGLRDLNNLILN